MQYKFKKGITDSQLDQLVEYSKSDPVILKFTSDHIRFKDKTSAMKWISSVDVYTLTEKAGNLVGITWFHKKLLPSDRDFTIKLDPTDFPITFAIRIYGEARGKGLSEDFMKKSFEKFFSRPRRSRALDLRGLNVWIETSFDNIPTIKLAEKFGFVKASNPDQRRKIIMIRTQL